MMTSLRESHLVALDGGDGCCDVFLPLRKLDITDSSGDGAADAFGKVQWTFIRSL